MDQMSLKQNRSVVLGLNKIWQDSSIQFNKHFLRVYYVGSPVLGAVAVKVNKRQYLPFHSLLPGDNTRSA